MRREVFLETRNVTQSLLFKYTNKREKGKNIKILAVNIFRWFDSPLTFYFLILAFQNLYEGCALASDWINPDNIYRCAGG